MNHAQMACWKHSERGPRAESAAWLHEGESRPLHLCLWELQRKRRRKGSSLCLVVGAIDPADIGNA